MDNLQKHLQDINADLKAWAFYLTQNNEEAKDLFQDAMLKIYVNSSKFTHNGNFKSWCLTIMRNIYLNQIKRKKIVTYEAEYTQYRPKDSNETPLQSLLYHEIIGFINALPNALRETFQLYTTGYKYNEIADKLDVPIGTVKSRINSTRKILQHKLN